MWSYNVIVARNDHVESMAQPARAGCHGDGRARG
jgi:hypothetical protein